MPRIGAGRPRTRPDTVIADRAYTRGVTRRMLRTRKITAVIPQERDAIAARARRGSAGGRPQPSMKSSTSNAISSNDHSPCSSNGAPYPLATTSSPSSIEPPLSSAPASPGPAI